MQSTPLPVLALLFNALVWGLAWWPFRRLLEAGLHPLWATALMYAGIALALLLARSGLWAQVRAAPALALLAVSSGLNNVAFNWAITIGDVVRVILLFYLMPAWAVLLAWRLLGERPTGAALARLALAFAGVLLVLWPAQGAQSLGGALGLADALALLGGFMFALTNVLLRRLQAVPGPARMLAMFGGCLLMAGAAALAGQALGQVPAFPAFDVAWAGVAVALALLLVAGNWALQYGAARRGAGTAAVGRRSEVVFASGSSMLTGGSAPTARTLLGGALVVGAALAAALRR